MHFKVTKRAAPACCVTFSLNVALFKCLENYLIMVWVGFPHLWEYSRFVVVVVGGSRDVELS